MKLKKAEAILLAVIVLISVGFGIYFYFPRNAKTVAVISTDGTQRYGVALWKNEASYVFSISKTTGKPVSFEVDAHRIRFYEVVCPDHICEKAGWCEYSGDRAICMPNRTTLICYDESEFSEPDDFIWIDETVIL